MGENAYEFSLPPTLKISSIFNVIDLTPYKGIEDSTSEQGDQADSHDEDYVTNLPQRKLVDLQEILDTMLLKKPEPRSICSTYSIGKGFPILMQLE